jgi:hypothetical protein
MVILNKRFLLAVVIYAALFEGSCFLFWGIYGAQRISYHLRVDDDPKKLAAMSKVWPSPGLVPDGRLGWSPNTNSAIFAGDGSRNSQSTFEREKVSAYGDSFVFGAEVTAEQSFPYQLSLMIGSGVKNFGVGGYGPDQAILRLEGHLIAGDRPKMVVLGMPSENIARTVNLFRRYYVPSEGPHFTKPLFILDDEQKWRLVDAIPRWPLSEVAWRKLLAATRDHDRWYAQNRSRPRLQFPYSLATFQVARFLLFDVLRWQDLYEDDRALSTMKYLLRHFVSLSKEYEFAAVFVIVPMPEDLLKLKEGGEPYYQNLLNWSALEFGGDLKVVDVVRGREIDLKRFHVRPFSGHASAYGNGVVAKAIHERIRDVIEE